MNLEPVKHPPLWALTDETSAALDASSEDSFVLVLRTPSGQVLVRTHPWTWLEERGRQELEALGIRPAPWPVRVLCTYDGAAWTACEMVCSNRRGGVA